MARWLNLIYIIISKLSKFSNVNINVCYYNICMHHLFNIWFILYIIIELALYIDINISII